MRKILATGCLYFGQPAMLEYVRNHPGCSQRQMADEARVTAASVATSFKRLENAGLISRRTDTADTRCRRVYITAAGEKELSNCQAAIEEMNVNMLTNISEEELVILKNCLRKMIKNLQNEKTEK